VKAFGFFSYFFLSARRRKTGRTIVYYRDQGGKEKGITVIARRTAARGKSGNFRDFTNTSARKGKH